MNPAATRRFISRQTWLEIQTPRTVTNTNAWKQPLLSDRKFVICRGHRLTTANTDGVEGMTIGDRQAQRELQKGTEEKTAEMVEKREAMERRKATDSLYTGTAWKKADAAPTPAKKRIAARDRIAIAMRKIAKAGQPARSAGRSDSGTRTDSACMLLIDGEPYTQNDLGQWVHTITGELHPSSSNG